jgi:hypothetical protein
MIVKELIAKSLLMATGKAKVLNETESKYVRLLAIGNIMQRMWAAEPDIEWDSRYSTISLGSITTDVVAMDPTIYAISKREGDQIYIQHFDSEQKSYFDLVRPSELYRSGRVDVCAVVAGELKFAKTFGITTPQYKGEVFVPILLDVEDLKRSTDQVIVDDPNWLVFMTAAEYVRNDVTKQNQYGNLVTLAENSMSKMKQNNSGQTDEVEAYGSVLGETWSDYSVATYGGEYGVR